MKPTRIVLLSLLVTMMVTGVGEETGENGTTAVGRRGSGCWGGHLPSDGGDREEDDADACRDF